MEDLLSKRNDRDNLVYVAPATQPVVCISLSVVCSCMCVCLMCGRSEFNVEDLEDVIRTTLKEIMMQVDLEEVTCKFVRHPTICTSNRPYRIHLRSWCLVLVARTSGGGDADGPEGIQVVHRSGNVVDSRSARLSVRDLRLPLPRLRVERLQPRRTQTQRVRVQKLSVHS